MHYFATEEFFGGKIFVEFFGGTFLCADRGKKRKIAKIRTRKASVPHSKWSFNFFLSGYCLNVSLL